MPPHAAAPCVPTCAQVNYVAESWRQARFVYQTGKMFEQLDTQLQRFDGKLGSPSKAVDTATAFLAGEVCLARSRACPPCMYHAHGHPLRCMARALHACTRRSLARSRQ